TARIAPYNVQAIGANVVNCNQTEMIPQKWRQWYRSGDSGTNGDNGTDNGDSGTNGDDGYTDNGDIGANRHWHHCRQCQ
ncbi:hypothetical protein ACHWQZ_G013829, partial [Mnemiopsis leidyi]